MGDARRRRPVAPPRRRPPRDGRRTSGTSSTSSSPARWPTSSWSTWRERGPRSPAPQPDPPRAPRAARRRRARRCSSSTGWPSDRPPRCPPTSASWPGPVWALDLSGHGDSDVAIGGGYFCEALMGDVDLAIAHLGAVTIHGRGLGAYVGLLASGGRAEQVRGAILADGPGLAGGGATPVVAGHRQRRRRPASGRDAGSVGRSTSSPATSGRPTTQRRSPTRPPCAPASTPPSPSSASTAHPWLDGGRSPSPA